MIAKNGFLLIELMISFTLVFFLIFIITHYIIEIKNIQQEALARIELLSIARNITEKMIVFGGEKELSSAGCDDCTIKIINKQVSTTNFYNVKQDKTLSFIKDIVVEKKGKNYNRSIFLSLYAPKKAR